MIPDLKPTEILVVQAIALAGALVQSSIGFGYALIAVPLLALIDLQFVPGPVLLAATLLSVLTAGRELEHVDFKSIRWAVLGRLPGIAVAVWVWRISTGETIQLIVGVLVCMAVLLSLGGLRVAVSAATLAAAGLVSGFMGTVAAVGGPPLAMLFQYRSGEYIRGTLAGYFVLSAMMSLTALAAAGLFGWKTSVYGMILVPGTAMGFILAQRVKFLMTGPGVRIAVLSVSGIAGLGIILKSLLN